MILSYHLLFLLSPFHRFEDNANLMRVAVLDPNILLSNLANDLPGVGWRGVVLPLDFTVQWALN